MSTCIEIDYKRSKSKLQINECVLYFFNLRNLRTYALVNPAFNISQLKRSPVFVRIFCQQHLTNWATMRGILIVATQCLPRNSIVSMYTYIHIYDICIYICTCTYICGCVCMYICICVHIDIPKGKYIHTYIYIHIEWYVYINVHIYMYIYICIYIYIYTYVHIYVYINRHIDKQM